MVWNVGLYREGTLRRYQIRLYGHATCHGWQTATKALRGAMQRSCDVLRTVFTDIAVYGNAPKRKNYYEADRGILGCG